MQKESNSSDITIRSLKEGSWPSSIGNGKLILANAPDTIYAVSGIGTRNFRMQIIQRSDNQEIFISQERNNWQGLPVAAGFCLKRLPLAQQVASSSVDIFDVSRWNKRDCFFSSLPPDERRSKFSYKFRWDSAGDKILFTGESATVWPGNAETTRRLLGSSGVLVNGIMSVQYAFDPEQNQRSMKGTLAVFIDAESLDAVSILHFEKFDDNNVGQGYAMCSIAATRVGEEVKY